MLISLNWLKDFVDVPADLDPNYLALRFTLATAEVEGVEHVEPNFAGLVAVEIDSVRRKPGEDNLKYIVVSAGKTKYNSVTTAPNIRTGDKVIYAPPGATIAGHTFGTTDPQGRPAEGMIVAGQSIGLVQVGAHAIFLPPSVAPGSPIDPAPFDDWLIEVDNKSLTHRPDCWGHYGIAREVAAILRTPLKPYDVTPITELQNDRPAIPIEIDNAEHCPRYAGLLMKGLRSQPAPLEMQVRLALCGMRPIDLLVDLTNYIMLELGQPMHAFDGAAIPDIQVATAKPDEAFTTLDGVTRKMPQDTLMIQSGRKSVAIAGIMGGAQTEVGEKTETILLESANFDAATIRRAATAMGHRTEASARFEKSLDPENAVIGIARFHRLAQRELPSLELAGTLSDCYPKPITPKPIQLDCAFTARFIGKEISPDQIVEILERLEFRCRREGEMLSVTPPTFRATKDIEIEADLIEEVSRSIGYDNIEPSLPSVASRCFEPSQSLTLEESTLNYLCVGNDFAEVRLRTTLVPGLVAFAEGNRHHYDRFQLAQIGSVFEAGHDSVEASQHRQLGLVVAQLGKKADGIVWDRLRDALHGWARQAFERPLGYVEAEATRPWEDADRIAEITLAGRTIGRVTVLPLALRQKIDERLKAWSFAVAELSLTEVASLTGYHEKLPPVPRHPQVELDYSVLVDAQRKFAGIQTELAVFEHPLLKQLSFVGSYEGGSIPSGKRSLTLRTRIGHDDRTLTDEEIQDFGKTFRTLLDSHAMEIRG